jgi:Ras-related protein Rab-6A
MATRPAKSFRVVMIGDASVGKTSLITRLTQDVFSDGQMTTIGTVFCEFRCEIDGRAMMLEIWDTAGQEKFKSVVPMYFRDSHGAVATFSVDTRSSFENLKLQIAQFREIGPSAVLVLAANKSDLPISEGLTQEEIQLYAKSQNCEVFFTSAKTGASTADLFLSLCRSLYQNSQNICESVDPNQEDESSCC